MAPSASSQVRRRRRRLWLTVRCLVASTLLPCHAALGLSFRPAPATAATIVRGTLFLPSTGDRRVRLFLHEHSSPSSEHPAQAILVLDLPAGLAGADIAATGRIVLECQRQWNDDDDDCRGGGGGALLDSPKWLVYCNGRRVVFAERREKPSDAEGWVLEKLWAVTAGAGVEYLRGRFERTVASSDAESFHLVDHHRMAGIQWQRRPQHLLPQDLISLFIYSTQTEKAPLLSEALFYLLVPHYHRDSRTPSLSATPIEKLMRQHLGLHDRLHASLAELP